MPAFSLVRIFAMFALLLMPLAMAAKGHAAAATPHQAAAASGQEDCHKGSNRQHEEHRQGGVAHCMMACAALPAAEAPAPAQAEVLRPTLYALPIVPISGLAPEAAIPPPRTA